MLNSIGLQKAKRKEQTMNQKNLNRPLSVTAASSAGSSGRVFLMEAANGLQVRVPEEKLDSFLEAQQNRQPELTPAEQKFRDRILQRIFGSTK